MTRKELGDAIGLTEDWVKKFEEGRRQSDPRISTLRSISKAFRVSLADILNDEPVTQSDEEIHDTAVLRAVLLAPATGPTRGADLDALRRECEYGFASFQAGSYGTLLATVPRMIKTAKALPDDPASARAAYRVHHLAANTLMKFEGGTAAWHAAEQAVKYATASQDPIAIALAAQALTYAMINIREARAGMTTAISYADQLEGVLSDGSVPGSSALGMLWLKGAVAAAACGEPDSACEMLDLARRCADLVPAGANYHSTGFDQLNVRLYQVSVDVALDNFAPAANAADQLGFEALRALPRERRTHHLIETAQTYTRLRRTDDALAALLHAEGDNPSEIHRRPAARKVIRDLLHAPGPAPARLRELAARARIEP